MHVTVQDIRTGRTRTMDKKFADILVKLKRVTFDVVAEAPALGPVYNTSMMTAKFPAAEKPVKEKKPKKEKKKAVAKEPKVVEPELTLTKEPVAEVEKKEYQTKVMIAGD